MRLNNTIGNAKLALDTSHPSGERMVLTNEILL
jgi:hypothetical protein